MKNGLIYEDGKLVYYKDDHLHHAGIIQVDGDIYYINSQGHAVTGDHIVHGVMTNDIVKRGTYTFGPDYKLIKGSYVPPKKNKKGKTKDKNMAKAEKKVLFITIVSLLALTLVMCLGIQLHNILMVPGTSDRNDTTVPTQPQIKVSLPSFQEDVLLCSPGAKLEYDGNLSLSAIAGEGNPYVPFRFNYTLTNANGILKLSESADLTFAREYVLSSDSYHILIDNLKTGTTYYYKVIVDGKEYPGSFRTAQSTRFVNIPGLVNTRDIGGYKTMDGRTVKQGVLIRGVELDGLVNAPYFLPADQVENVLQTFGFVHEMDLRQSSVYSGTYRSRLGSEVGHKFYEAPQYGQIFSDIYKGSLLRIFSDLADASNYPMYLHCTWGRDRTGTIVFLLQGILGVSQEDMIREYRLSSFATPGMADSTNMDVIIHGLEPYEGDTLNDKIENYLINYVGVTPGEIDSIRNIFLN
jgi:protein-tyrosine phosphatase